MKSNTRAEILEAWDDGQLMFWFWNDGHELRELYLSHIAERHFVANDNWDFDHCSIEDPRPKKKTRQMTNLEIAYFKGERKVFGYDTSIGDGNWFTEIFYENCEYTHYAEILNEGRRLGPWKPLEVVDDE
jgi:hypothetical protein